MIFPIFKKTISIIFSYLYASHLLLGCLKVAARVGDEVLLLQHLLPQLLYQLTLIVDLIILVNKEYT